MFSTESGVHSTDLISKCLWNDCHVECITFFCIYVLDVILLTYLGRRRSQCVSFLWSIFSERGAIINSSSFFLRKIIFGYLPEEENFCEIMWVNVNHVHNHVHRIWPYGSLYTEHAWKDKKMTKTKTNNKQNERKGKRNFEEIICGWYFWVKK